MVTFNFTVLMAILTVTQLILAQDDLEFTGSINDDEYENIYKNNVDKLVNLIKIEKIQSTEIDGKESDKTTVNEEKHTALSNEEQLNENESIMSEPDEMNNRGRFDANDKVVIESNSSEDKSGSAQTDMVGIEKVRNIFNASPRVGNIPGSSPTLDSYEYSSQTGNNIYPINKVQSLQQHIQSLYNTKFYSPGSYNAVPQQSSRQNYIRSNPYRAFEPASHEKLNSDNASDQNSYPYSPPSVDQLKPNYYRIGNPFTTQQRENAPTFYHIDQSQIQLLSTLNQERLRRNGNVAPVSNPFFRYIPTFLY